MSKQFTGSSQPILVYDYWNHSNERIYCYFLFYFTSSENINLRAPLPLKLNQWGGGGGIQIVVDIILHYPVS